ncbi:MAG: endonuclease [Bacteroidetes bacterium]|nr:endonuclease [Bacteroidota bacterium]
MKKFIISVLFVFLFSGLFAQIPAGYYDSAAGLVGTPLKAALHNIIKNHTVVSYAGLWTAYSTTDKKANGYVWDMYSDIPSGTPPYNFTFGTDQCGSYSVEGDCYNREHSFPQSLFNSTGSIYSDLFQVYPTDGKVNGQRSNFPLANVGTASWTSLNGSKLGISNYVSPDGWYNFSGTAFEPIDDFKGDFARTYFYIATRYYTEDAGWSSNGMNIGAEPMPWAICQYLEWSHLDPVSTKEINRNNAVYGKQNNRNPFIDHPEWADSIWGSFLTAGMTHISDFNTISVFPNPCTIKNTKVNIWSPEKGSFTLKLFNIEGKCIIEKTIEKTTGNIETELNVEVLNKGIYFLNVSSKNFVSNKKLIIQ